MSTAWAKMKHCRLVDLLPRLAGMQFTDGKIECDGLTISTKCKEIKQFGISLHKVLAVVLIELYNNRNATKCNSELIIPLEKYINFFGFSSPSAFNRMLKTQLDLLRNLRFEWTEICDKCDTPYDLTILKSANVHIKRRLLTVTLDKSFCDFIRNFPTTQYPLALLGIDNNNSAAYGLGVGLALYYCIPANSNHHKADRLKISTMLKYTNIKPYDSYKKTKRSWWDLTGMRLLKAFDCLCSIGLLDGHSDEIDPYFNKISTTYLSWSDQVITFKLLDPPSIPKKDSS